MAKSLLIVESPTKAKTLTRHLGQRFRVLASVGHIKDLPKNKLGIEIGDGLSPQYVNIPGKEKIIKEIKKAAAGVKSIYLGPDPDREGEAIAWHLAQEVSKPGKNIHRALFNEFTQAAILKALENPAPLDFKKYEAQQARRIVDRLVGYLISPLLWEKVRYGLSAGRVQTVALRLIAEREKEIAVFVPEEYWSIRARLRAGQPPIFEAKLLKLSGKEAKVTSAEQAQGIVDQLKELAFVVEKAEKKEKREKAPPPFITSTLQQEAHNRLRFSAGRTMRLAQKLYEGVELKGEGQVGLITYMRTDSTRVSEEALAQARQTILQLYGRDYLPKKPIIYKSKKGAQDAHEAIRPAGVDRHPEALKEDLDRDLFRLYELIWRRFVACQMPPATFDALTADIAAGPGLFRASDSQRTFPGFLLAYPRRKEEDQQEKLPPLSSGERLALKELIPKQHFTEPPPRFTEASLIRELERLGIGRPSTYAAILANVQQRDYTYKDKGRFHATELGLLVTDLLVSAFPQIFDVKFTAAMEQRLDEIEAGKRKSGPSLKRFYRFLQENVEKAKKSMRNLKTDPVATDVVCEKCGSTMVIKWGKLGQFLACPSFPECDYTTDMVRDEAGIIRPSKHETDEICEKCGQPMVPKTGRYGRFLACSGYPDCKNTRPLGRKKPLSLGINCLRPDCDGEIIEKFSKKGRKFYGCNRFPKCDLAFWNKPLEMECPKCGAPFMLEKVSKDKGRGLSCPQEDCRHNIELAGQNL